MDDSKRPLPLVDPSEEVHAPLSGPQAVVESEACLQCGGPDAPAPCVTGCPAAVDIPGFIDDIAHGRTIDAARRIFAANVLGGSCARVCPVEELCQGKCVLLKEGRRPIQIGRLQRFATDRALEAGARVLPGPRARCWPGSVGVVGAGPAGLACAAELAKRGFAVTVYEQRRLAGGLITHAIAPYKQLVDPLPAELELIRALGVEFRFGVAVGRDISAAALMEKHGAIFLGVGMGEDLPARLPGEDRPGVWESLAFIEEVKLGRRDDLPIGGRVAVIGGGNTAIDVAREAVLLGAAEVMILYRRTEAQMPAYAHEIAAAKREGVKIISLVSPQEFVGKERITGVKCVKMRLGAPDASGRPRPEPVPGSEFVIEVDLVVKAIGQKPRGDLLGLFGIGLEDGVVKVDEGFRTGLATGRSRLYAGGDCTNGGATVVEAVRDGKLAARAIERDLVGLAAGRGACPAPTRVERNNGTLSHYQRDYRLTTVPRLCKGCEVCVTGCPTGTLFLNDADQIAVKDVVTCVFCGLCEARCPDFAIWTVKGLSARAAGESERVP